METFKLFYIKEEIESLPNGPIAHVVLNSFSRGGYTPDDPMLLTPQCITSQELDSHIDDLIEQLEKLRKEGKRKFDASYKRIQTRSKARK